MYIVGVFMAMFGMQPQIHDDSELFRLNRPIDENIR